MKTSFQPTPDDLVTSLLDFIRRKFYPDHAIQFAKDRPRLLSWVVLWPARWLDSRGVTLPSDEYRRLLESVLMDALRFGTASKVTYLPAYLKQIIQSHFSHHGEEIYEKAKSTRTLAERALLVTGQLPSTRPDPVRDLAAAARLLQAKKYPRKLRCNSPAATQQTLF